MADKLPPSVLLALTLIFGALALVIGGGLVLVALRPTQINADHGGMVDYSPRVEVEMARPQDKPRAEGDTP